MLYTISNIKGREKPAFMKFCKMNGAGNDFIILNNLEERLPWERFASPHKSFLVNLAQVSGISGAHLVLSGGREIPISRSHREEFLAALHSFILRKGG